jgi:hypothetical protein
MDADPVNPPVQGAAMGAYTLAAAPGKTFAPNLKQFPVTPGAAYTLDTSLSAPAAADHAGYVTVIFLDAAGKGMSRENLWFRRPSNLWDGRRQTLAAPSACGCPQMLLRPGRRFAPSGRAAHRFDRPWPFCRGHRLRCEQGVNKVVARAIGTGALGLCIACAAGATAGLLDV